MAIQCIQSGHPNRSGHTDRFNRSSEEERFGQPPVRRMEDVLKTDCW